MVKTALIFKLFLNNCFLFTSWHKVNTHLRSMVVHVSCNRLKLTYLLRLMSRAVRQDFFPYSYSVITKSHSVASVNWLSSPCSKSIFASCMRRYNCSKDDIGVNLNSRLVNATRCCIIKTIVRVSVEGLKIRICQIAEADRMPSQLFFISGCRDANLYDVSRIAP